MKIRKETRVNVEHRPFIGSEYHRGINGKKIAVVGYSHWHDGADHEDFSISIMQKLLKGECKPRFFAAIRNSFNFDSHKEFWDRVLFFNYVPIMIGTGAERFGKATNQQALIANARFERVLDEHSPDLVFVFSKKTQLGALQLRFERLSGPFQGFVRAQRISHNHTCQIIRLRHPQGANGAALKQAISHFVNA